MSARRHRRRTALPRRAAAAAALLLLIGGALRIDEAPAVGSSRSDGGTPVGAREPVGCTSRPGAVAANGPRSRNEVALTFDDGPSLMQTPAILATLERLHARATFFEEGDHVQGREALMRQILAAGDEIGNHSFDHPLDPGYGELAATDRRIRAATGFEPCLFRPPYGLLDARVAAAALRNRLATVLWDVNSQDDRHPGAAAIRANVLSLAQPGSIVLMHDGGHHPQTVRALPGVIRGLRARGFRFVTVTELLGGRMRYSR
jgi:peptidoglycan/xylan/chitin deacetylase (PgdA/CDA1 family)